MAYKKDISSYIGKVFDRLTIIEDLGIIGGNRHVLAICECGIEKSYGFQNIKRGNTRSCGCLFDEVSMKVKTKHGFGNHPLANIWRGMIRRCYNIKDIAYEHYGGRGVIVCKEWLEDFMNFYNWAIYNGYKKGLQLDKDKLAPTQTGSLYCPEYCCFLTPKQNMRYRSDSVMIEYNNETKGLAEWSYILGIDSKLIRSRFKRKWSSKKIFETPCLEKFRNKRVLK